MIRQEAVPAAELPIATVTPRVRGLIDSVRAYVALTKPRIVTLLLITTVPAMILAEGGMPSIWLVLLTLLGGTLSAAGANAINCYIDRDIDGIMYRTRERPLPAGWIEPERALLFGITLGVAGFEILALGVNLLSAVLATSALLFYVFVYTLWLKRTSTQNIVIGGAAGAMPPVIGWAAVTGNLGWVPLLLFGVIFFWTPPHFWALALRYRGDYERAGVPMLPVVRGEQETNRQIVLYTLILAAAAIALGPIAGLGYVYMAAALLLSVGFVALAVRLWRKPRPSASRALFLYSLIYLGTLYVSIAVDVLLLG